MKLWFQINRSLKQWPNLNRVLNSEVHKDYVQSNDDTVIDNG